MESVKCASLSSTCVRGQDRDREQLKQDAIEVASFLHEVRIGKALGDGPSGCWRWGPLGVEDACALPLEWLHTLLMRQEIRPEDSRADEHPSAPRRCGLPASASTPRAPSGTPVLRLHSLPLCSHSLSLCSHSLHLCSHSLPLRSRRGACRCLLSSGGALGRAGSRSLWCSAAAMPAGP